MPYPANLQTVTRKLAPGIVTSSGPFQILGSLNIGYRMALFQRGDAIVVWSAIPYGPEVEDALKLLTGKVANVTHFVVPNVQHTFAAKSFKEKFPELKFFATRQVSISGVPIDYVFGPEQANKITGHAELVQLGVTDQAILDSFEFVYLSGHKNKELVLYDKVSKSIFSGDIVFNLGIPGTTSGETVLEQYSPETGFEKGYNPHGGWSFFTRYLQPNSLVGQRLTKRFIDPNDVGLKAIHSWDFDRLVMCHGNVIEKGGKEVLETLFPQITEPERLSARI